MMKARYGLMVFLIFMSVLSVEAQRSTTGTMDPAEARAYFTDTLLVDQEGRQVRFYSDLLEGKVVVIDTIFTNCTGICPVLSGTFARLQDGLGDRMERDVRLISISVDPENDSPARLKEYAKKFQAGKGWHFLTGDRRNIDAVLRKLGQWVPDKEGHLGILLIGNVAKGLWKKTPGVSPPQEIIQIVESVIGDQG